MNPSNRLRDKNEWAHFANSAISHSISHQAVVPGHSPSNAFDDPPGLSSTSLLNVGAEFAQNMSYSSQPCVPFESQPPSSSTAADNNTWFSQCSQGLSAELEEMPSDPTCHILLGRNAMNPQYFESLQFPPSPVNGGYSNGDMPIPSLDISGANDFDVMDCSPPELYPGGQSIPKIQFHEPEPGSGSCYSSSYSSGRELSYPPTPHTPSIHSPSSDTESFPSESQVSFPPIPARSNSTYSSSMDGYDEDISQAFDVDTSPCLLGPPSNQYLKPESSVQSYSSFLGRQGRSLSPIYCETISHRPCQIATGDSLSPSSFSSDASYTPLAPPMVISDRPRSSSDSFLTRTSSQALKRERVIEETPAKEDDSAEDLVVRPHIDDAPLKPRRPRGKRRGPLSQSKKVQLNISRTEGKTCLNCCLSKVRCNGEWPCQRCVPGFDTRHLNMCTKAHFRDLIKRTSTVSSMLPSFYMSVLGSYHFPMNQPPVNIEEFDISYESLSKVKELSAHWNLVVYFANTQLHIIDMSELCRSLSVLHKNRSSPFSFDTVFETHSSRGSRPEKTLLKMGGLPYKLEVFVKWTNVLKFTTLVQVSKNDMRTQEISYGNPFYQIASQIVLIELRRFERNVYDSLSKTLHNQGARAERDPNAVPELVGSLGSLLLSLRWNICLWKIYRSHLGDDGHQVKREQRFDTIQDLCKRLYPYYFLCRERCLSDPLSGEARVEEMRYANMDRDIREHFPRELSEEGFEEWIKEGEKTVQNCGVGKSTLIQSIL